MAERSSPFDMLLSLLALSFELANTVHASLQIVPGATWTAANTGLHVQAHGGSITKSNGLYYLSERDRLPP